MEALDLVRKAVENGNVVIDNGSYVDLLITKRYGLRVVVQLTSHTMLDTPPNEAPTDFSVRTDNIPVQFKSDEEVLQEKISSLVEQKQWAKETLEEITNKIKVLNTLGGRL